MRHRKAGRKLKRTASHKRATLIALSTALLRHKKIRTTLAKAQETRPFVERLITRAKTALQHETTSGKKDVHARREAFRSIKDRSVIQELFGDIASKVQSRPGGYTRVVKLGQRQGDSAHVAILELVDFNTGAEPKTPTKEKKKEESKKEEKKKQGKLKEEKK